MTLRIIHNIIKYWTYLAFLLLSCSAYSLDVIVTNSGQSSKDIRSEYIFKVIGEALEKTTDEFGPYKFEINDYSLPNARKLQQVNSGKNINIGMAEYKKNKPPFVSEYKKNKPPFVSNEKVPMAQ